MTDTIPENTSTTVTLSAAQTITGTIDPADVSGGVDHDWYKVTLTAGHTYTLTDSTAPSFNYTLASGDTFYLATSAGGSELNAGGCSIVDA